MNNITRRLMILLMILCLVSVGYTPSASARLFLTPPQIHNNITVLFAQKDTDQAVAQEAAQRSTTAETAVAQEAAQSSTTAETAVAQVGTAQNAAL